MASKPLRVSQGSLRFLCDFDSNTHVVRVHIWVYKTAFSDSGEAAFDNEYISLRVTANKKGRRGTIELRDFVTEPNQKRRSIHRYGEYELIVKKPCFDWFTENYWKTHGDKEIYIPPNVNLCMHTNPHHKVIPVEGVTKLYQGGGVNPR